MANTLAYYYTPMITAIQSHIGEAPETCTINFFTDISFCHNELECLSLPRPFHRIHPSLKVAGNAIIIAAS